MYGNKSTGSRFIHLVIFIQWFYNLAVLYSVSRRCVEFRVIQSLPVLETPPRGTCAQVFREIMERRKEFLVCIYRLFILFIPALSVLKIIYVVYKGMC